MKENNLSNRPSPSCFETRYKSEASCILFIMKISFHSYAVFTGKALPLTSLS